MPDRRDELRAAPNQFTKPLEVHVTKDFFKVEGYQNFHLLRDPLHIKTDDMRLIRKMAMLAPVFSNLEGKTFLDLGCNTGFWSFLAAENGVTYTKGLDMDRDAAEAALYGARWLGIEEKIQGLYFAQAQQPYYLGTQPVDVVNAQALIHWLYDCTASFKSLQAILEYLRSLTKETLIVEWIDAEDPNILSHGHLGDSHPDWTIDNFLAILDELFTESEMVGQVSDTRELYVAHR